MVRRSVFSIAMLAIVIGAYVRVHAIDRKVYGVDETVTALRVAGATLPEFRESLASGASISLADVRSRFQMPQPNDSAWTTVRALVEDDPQHPPLYFLLQRAWRIFGDAIAIRRSLAVLFGLALLPATWWLAAERYDRTVAAVAVALVAVSPFHALYAQYDREYSLWALLTVLASACVCRALERPSAISWTAYAIALGLGLYTDPFFFLVLVAHVAYVIAVARRRTPRARTRGFWVGSALALAAYAPWLAVIVRERHVVLATTQWYAVALPPALLASKWAFEIAAVFFDAEYASPRLVIVAAVVLAFVGAVLAWSVRAPQRGRASFAIALLVSSAVPLVLGDLIFHESRSTASRYLAPAWLAVELLAAAALVAWTRDARGEVRAFGSIAFAALVVLGVGSLMVSGGKTAWWIDSHDAPFVAIARDLDDRPGATLCSVDDDESILVLASAVRVPVRLSRQIEPRCLRIATASELRSPSRVRWRRVDPAARDDDPAVAYHAQTSRAHGMVFEEPELWYASARSRP